MTYKIETIPQNCLVLSCHTNERRVLVLSEVFVVMILTSQSDCLPISNVHL
jgi:hypothetical protein